MNIISHRRSSGFTVIELIFIILLLSAASLLFFFQKTSLETANSDERRKIAINAIYYNLEEVFYPKNGYYPSEINEKNLTAMDPGLLTDTNGVKIDQELDTTGLDDETKNSLTRDEKRLSLYRYEPTNCDNTGKCKSYTLRVALVNEAEYVKKSRHN